MSFWARLTLVMMIGSFPFAIYHFSLSSTSPAKKKRPTPVATRGDEKPMDLAVAEINRGVDAKAKELREIEVKILQNKGSILKLEEDKRAFVNNLESLQAQISSVIKNARGSSAPK